MALENYYLCSQVVVDHFKPEKVSKPFKSGYEYDKEDNYFVAWLDWEKVESYYNEVVEPVNDNENLDDIDFWAFELTAGNIDVSDICLNDIKRNGLFNTIQRETGLTKNRNRAMTIYNLAERQFLEPIDFINMIA